MIDPPDERVGHVRAESSLPVSCTCPASAIPVDLCLDRPKQPRLELGLLMTSVSTGRYEYAGSSGYAGWRRRQARRLS